MKRRSASLDYAPAPVKGARAVLSSSPGSSAPPSSRAATWLLFAGVIITTFLVFLPNLNHQFVEWDDHHNFLKNMSYRGLGADQLRWMWTTFHMGHYMPLTWMSL